MKLLCIACGSKIGKLGESGGFEVFKCPRCGLGRTVGGGREDIERYHRDEIYDILRPRFSNIFKKRVDLVTRFKKHGRVLEIGSSIGLLLLVLKKRGWEVEGIEPSGPAYRLSEKEGIPTQNTSFEKAKLKEAFYDLVVLNHVLEHMIDPKEVLAKVKKILKKDGLVFIDVPNFGGVKAGTMGAQWRFILPDEHKWHFTRHSLGIILRNLGFEVVYTETRSGVWDYSNPIKELFLSFFGFKKRFFSEFLFVIPDFIVSRLGLGSGLTVIARKIR